MRAGTLKAVQLPRLTGLPARMKQPEANFSPVFLLVKFETFWQTFSLAMNTSDRLLLFQLVVYSNISWKKKKLSEVWNLWRATITLNHWLLLTVQYTVRNAWLRIFGPNTPEQLRGLTYHSHEYEDETLSDHKPTLQKANVHRENSSPKLKDQTWRQRKGTSFERNAYSGMHENVIDFSVKGKNFEKSDVQPGGKWRKTYLPGWVSRFAIERTCEDLVKTSMD